MRSALSAAAAGKGGADVGGLRESKARRKLRRLIEIELPNFRPYLDPLSTESGGVRSFRAKTRDPLRVEAVQQLFVPHAASA